MLKVIAISKTGFAMSELSYVSKIEYNSTEKYYSVTYGVTPTTVTFSVTNWMLVLEQIEITV